MFIPWFRACAWLAVLVCFSGAVAWADVVVDFWANSPSSTTLNFSISGTYTATANQTWPATSRNVWGGGDFLSASIGSNPVYDFPITGSLAITNLTDSSTVGMSHIFLRHVGHPGAQDQIAFRFGQAFTSESGDILSLSGAGSLDLSFHGDTFADFMPGTYSPIESDSRYMGNLTLHIFSIPEPGSLSMVIGCLVLALRSGDRRSGMRH